MAMLADGCICWIGHCGECPDMNYMGCKCLVESEKD
jgi:hypothetical protein